MRIFCSLHDTPLVLQKPPRDIMITWNALVVEVCSDQDAHGHSLRLQTETSSVERIRDIVRGLKAITPRASSQPRIQNAPLALNTGMITFVGCAVRVTNWANIVSLETISSIDMGVLRCAEHFQSPLSSRSLSSCLTRRT